MTLQSLAQNGATAIPASPYQPKGPKKQLQRLANLAKLRGGLYNLKFYIEPL